MRTNYQSSGRNMLFAYLKKGYKTDCSNYRAM
jgi:hypothetical protein